jgi:MFS family permease
MSRPLALVFLATSCTLTSFDLLLSVTPMRAAAAGAGSAGAGMVTAVLLLGTVGAELASSCLIRRYGYRPVLAAGAVLLGVPSLVLLAHASLAVLAAASVIRGFGFGLGTVVLDTLAALLVPADRRGEGLGLLGVFATVPGVVALPAGVWLAGHVGYPIVVGLTAAAALVPLVALAWLPARPASLGAGPGGQVSRRDGHGTGLLAGLRQIGLRRPALIFAASTAAAGVVVSFLPLASGITRNVAAIGLLAQALTATVGRWWAGRRGDRIGHGRLLTPALAIGSLGLAGLIWPGSPVAVITGMCLFGAGFGVLENATFALMIDRMPPAGAGTASAIWNLAYDGGYGAGPAVFGLFVGVSGYPVAFALTGLLILTALPAARRERPERPRSLAWLSGVRATSGARSEQPTGAGRGAGRGAMSRLHGPAGTRWPATSVRARAQLRHRQAGVRQSRRGRPSGRER